MNMKGVALALSVILGILPVAQANAMARATTGIVNGAVVAADSGLPLTGVLVRVVNMDSAETIAEAKTSDDGKVDFSEVPFGLYQVSIIAPAGYAATAGPLVFLDEENSESLVNFALVPTVPTTFQDEGSNLLLWLLIGGAVVGTGIIIWQVSKDDTG
jgi:hypothetical protein